MSIDLETLSAAVERPDEQARARQRDRLPLQTGSPGALGRLEDLVLWLAGTQGAFPVRPVADPRLVLFAADHGIATAGVSARRPGDSVRGVLAVVDGTGPAALLAEVSGAHVRVVDVGLDTDDDLPAAVGAHRVRRGSGRIDRESALTPDETERAFQTGRDAADAAIDAGADLLLTGTIGVGASTPASVVVAALTGMDAASATGRGSGIDDQAWIRKCAAIRDALRRARPVAAEPLTLLATSGGADLAASAGFLLQAAVRRTPVVLDGLVSTAAALVVQRIAFRAPDWMIPGQLTPEPCHAKAVDRLALKPVLDYGVRQDEGTGALLALPVLKAAAALAAGLPVAEAPAAVDAT